MRINFQLLVTGTLCLMPVASLLVAFSTGNKLVYSIQGYAKNPVKKALEGKESGGEGVPTKKTTVKKSAAKTPSLKAAKESATKKAVKAPVNVEAQPTA